MLRLQHDVRVFITEIVRGEELGTMGRSSRDLRKYTAWQDGSCDIVKSLSHFYCAAVSLCTIFQIPANAIFRFILLILSRLLYYCEL